MSVLKAAATLARQRAEDQARLVESLRDRAREMVVGLVTEANPPAPDEILEVCDALGVPLQWFETAVKRCEARVAEVQGLERVPGLRVEAEKLERESRTLGQQAAVAKEKLHRAVALLRDPSGILRGQYFREDVTAEELQRKQELAAESDRLADSVWLAARDARRLRREISQLEKIDHSNIDVDSSLPSPHDFALPPIGKESAATTKASVVAQATDPDDEFDDFDA